MTKKPTGASNQGVQGAIPRTRFRPHCATSAILAKATAAAPTMPAAVHIRRRACQCRYDNRWASRMRGNIAGREGGAPERLEGRVACAVAGMRLPVRMLAQGAHLLAPPQANHAIEIRPLAPVPSRMIRPQVRPATVRHAHERAPAALRETHLHRGALVGREIGVAPGEGEQVRRVPRAHATDLEYMWPRIAVDGLEQSP